MRIDFRLIGVLLGFSIGGCGMKDDLLHLNAVYNMATTTDSLILYASDDTTVGIYATVTRKNTVRIKTKWVNIFTPLLRGDLLIYPDTADQLVGRNIRSNAEVWRTALDGRCDRAALVDDSTLLCSIDHVGLVAMAASTGTVRWTALYDYAQTLTPDGSGPFWRTIHRCMWPTGPAIV